MKRLRELVRVVAFCLASAVGFGAVPAQAADNIEQLKEKLLKNDDFRVRTQAALALGATADAKAVPPLCSGLKDGNDSVRAAVAAALGKLQKGGADCLKARLKEEKTDNVKKMIEKAIRLVEEAQAGPVLGPSTKFYVTIGKTTDQTGRGGTEVDGLVRATMRKAAGSLRGCAVAPDGESDEQAKRRLRKAEHVEGYLLQPKVFPPETSGGNVVVRIDLLVFSFPDKSLQGSVTQEAGMPGTKSPATENRLIEAVAQRAFEEFGRMASEAH